MTTMPHLCQVITVQPEDLPPGHRYVIVQRADREAVVFAANDERSQLEARAAFLEWDRQRGRGPVVQRPNDQILNSMFGTIDLTFPLCDGTRLSHATAVIHQAGRFFGWRDPDAPAPGDSDSPSS